GTWRAAFRAAWRGAERTPTRVGERRRRIDLCLVVLRRDPRFRDRAHEPNPRLGERQPGLHHLVGQGIDDVSSEAQEHREPPSFRPRIGGSVGSLRIEHYPCGTRNVALLALRRRYPRYGEFGSLQ